MYRPDSFIIYLGAIGQLLEFGQLEEAQAMSDRRPGQPEPPITFHLLH